MPRAAELGAAKEYDMVDPEEMKTGGLGTFAVMERERQAAREAGSPAGATGVQATPPLTPIVDDAAPAPRPQPHATRADKTTKRPSAA
jgi:hypothetical protein